MDILDFLMSSGLRSMDLEDLEDVDLEFKNSSSVKVLECFILICFSKLLNPPNFLPQWNRQGKSWMKCFVSIWSTMSVLFKIFKPHVKQQLSCIGGFLAIANDLEYFDSFCSLSFDLFSFGSESSWFKSMSTSDFEVASEFRLIDP